MVYPTAAVHHRTPFVRVSVVVWRAAAVGLPGRVLRRMRASGVGGDSGGAGGAKRAGGVEVVVKGDRWGGHHARGLPARVGEACGLRGRWVAGCGEGAEACLTRSPAS